MSTRSLFHLIDLERQNLFKPWMKNKWKLRCKRACKSPQKITSMFNWAIRFVFSLSVIQYNYSFIIYFCFDFSYKTAFSSHSISKAIVIYSKSKIPHILFEYTDLIHEIWAMRATFVYSFIYLVILLSLDKIYQWNSIYRQFSLKKFLCLIIIMLTHVKK